MDHNIQAYLDTILDNQERLAAMLENVAQGLFSASKPQRLYVEMAKTEISTAIGDVRFKTRIPIPHFPR